MKTPERSETSDSVEFGFGNRVLRTRGLGTLILLSVLFVAGAGLYTEWRLEQVTQSGLEAIVRELTENRRVGKLEHRDIEATLDRQACLLTMTMPERERFRSTFNVGAWSRWCPWIEGP